MPLPLPLFCWIFRGARRLGAPSRSFPDFAAKDRSFFSRTWSRAASSFAHGGSSSQWPRPPSLGSAGHLPTPFVPLGHFPLTGGVGPGPHITGDALLVGESRSSGAQNLSERLNSRRATGPWVYKNSGCCNPIFAPGFPNRAFWVVIAVGAGALTRPPIPRAKPEPHQPKRRDSCQ